MTFSYHFTNFSSQPLFFKINQKLDAISFVLYSQYYSIGSECSLGVSYAAIVDIVDCQDIHFPLVTDGPMDSIALGDPKYKCQTEQHNLICLTSTEVTEIPIQQSLIEGFQDLYVL